jgi:hypothetical protein
MPVIVKEVGAELLEGPVLVTIEYSVVLGHEAEFIEAIRKYARTRRRDGAYQWGIYRDTEVAWECALMQDGITVKSVCGDIPGAFVGRTSSSTRAPDKSGS